MFRLGLIFTCFFCIQSEWALSTTENPIESPLYISQSNIDLGILYADEKRRFSIQIRNRGNEILSIHSVSANCNCLNPVKKWKDVELQPRATENVEFELLVGSQMLGRKQKVIMFKTNNRQEKYTPVVVSFTVKQKYRLTVLPSILDFGTIQPEIQAELKAILVSPYPQPLKINSIRYSNSSLLLRLVHMNERQDILTYTITIPPYFKAGPLSESITIDTTIDKIIIPIVGYKVDVIECIPSEIIFPPITPNRSVKVVLIIANTSGKNFRINQVTTETDELCVKEENGLESKATHKLLVAFRPNKEYQGPGHFQIHIVTDLFGSKMVNCFFYIFR